VAGVAMLALSGCGGAPAPAPAQPGAPSASSAPGSLGPSPTASASPTKPARKGTACALVTGDDAAAALGVARALTPTTDKAGVCGYAASNGVDTIEVTVEREAYRAGLVDAVLGYLDEDKATKVAGVGDAALSYSLGPLGTQFHVWAKGRYVVITLSIISRSVATEAAARALAETAVGRL